MIACILGLILFAAAAGVVIYRIWTAEENEHKGSDSGNFYESGGSSGL